MKDIDISVEYETRTQDLNTKTDYDLPDDHLTIPKLSLPSQDSMSTVGTFNKNAYATKSDNYDDWNHPEDLTLYERLAKQGLEKDGQKGDMIITISIEIPKNLSKEEVILYEKLKQAAANRDIREINYEQ